MLTQPNQYTLTENGVTYGLHTFKDGIHPTVICQLHQSGEWITLAAPTEQQLKYFVTHGTKTVQPPAPEKKAKPLVSDEQPDALSSAP